MNFSKAKSFLIIMFLILDIFLLYNYFINNSQFSFGRQDTFNQTVKILENHNITLDSSITSFQKPNLYNINLINNSYNKDDFANLILGDFKKNKDNIYVSPKGTLSFSEGKYTLIPEYKEKIESLLPSYKTSENVLKQLKQMGFETKYLKWSSSFEEEKGIFKITYFQNFFEKELFSSPVTVYVTKDGINKINGCIYIPEVLNAGELKLKDKSEILIKFASFHTDKKKKYHISKLEDGYFINSDNFVSLTPSLSLKITINNGDEYFFDYTSSELLKKEEFSLN